MADNWDDVAKEADLLALPIATGTLRGPKEPPAPEAVGHQLARRRGAAHRCEPLDSGYRDPHDRQGRTDAAFVRDVANALAALGFDLDYIAARYDIAPRPRKKDS